MPLPRPDPARACRLSAIFTICWNRSKPLAPYCPSAFCLPVLSLVLRLFDGCFARIPDDEMATIHRAVLYHPIHSSTPSDFIHLRPSSPPHTPASTYSNVPSTWFELRSKRELQANICFENSQCFPPECPAFIVQFLPRISSLVCWIPIRVTLNDSCKVFRGFHSTLQSSSSVPFDEKKSAAPFVFLYLCFLANRRRWPTTGTSVGYYWLGVSTDNESILSGLFVRIFDVLSASNSAAKPLQDASWMKRFDGFREKVLNGRLLPVCVVVPMKF